MSESEHNVQVKPEVPNSAVSEEIPPQRVENEEEETNIDTNPNTSKRQREEEDDNNNGDNQLGSEDDDEDEDDEDDEEDDVGSRKRRRKRGANQFFDIEAEVDEEEEDEVDEDEEEAEILREQFISDDHGADEGPDNRDDRLHRQYDRRRQEAEDQDAEQLAETLKQRYRKTHSVYRGETAANGTVSQKLLMPSINDPSIYAIRCTPGREKDLVRRLYQKKRTLERQKLPLDILTVFQRDSFRGYIYIEAKRPDAIDKALQGMVNVFVRDKLLVSVKEYPDLLKQVKSSDVEIIPGIYVRISRGKYKGDLAIVDNLSENGLDVRCKLVPRLDYGRNDDFDADGKRIRSKIRPLPNLFNAQDAKMHDGLNLQQKGPRSYVYKGEEYEDGFLYKDFKLQYIQTKDVHPTLEELDRFQTGEDTDHLDLGAIAASLKNHNQADGKQSTAFQPGDKVEVRRGEQARTVGVVVEAALNEIRITVTDSGDPKFVNQKLTVPANDLRKIFNEGDHVRIVEGKHFDETGLVIKIDGDSVVIVSDQTKEDVRVFANFLVKATDASSNVNDKNFKYDIKDLVELSASTVGVIVKAEKNIFNILTSDGRLIDVKPTQIASKIKQSSREQIATDRNGFTIKVGDTVKEALGDKAKEGPIIHIYKNSLFIKSNELVENLGIFVTNRMNVETVATKDSMVSKKFGPDLSAMNPSLKLPDPLATQGLKTRVGGRDKLLYKDVVVTSGSYKGLKGKVTEADDLYARIELHTKSKKIKVLKNNLNVLLKERSVPYLRFIGANIDQPPAVNSFNQSSIPQSSGDRSAWNGGATPSVAGGASSWNSGNGTSWGGVSAWGSGAGGASVWGDKGGASAWGAGNTNGGTSAWGSGNTGGSSTWGERPASTWGNNRGDNSTWGGNRGGNSTWGSKGNGSTWGDSGQGGGGSVWGSKSNSARNGNNSSWGSR
ncbi:SPT5 [Candida pseudojiufengensis]|uniref:SPT5 n=1 Tax=Candida pseudojiufengensis TaxID=497109 RepID=UPI0022252D98|nr:SPT5 [Candida pseudojiufengensis]KAI5960672.1 SPT5 [Candida pseudojiufengensis]